MSKLQEISDKMAARFGKGKPLHAFHALFDAVDTFLLTPSSVTHNGCHVRDAVDMKRIMITVMFALCPALLFGWWNVGYQHFLSEGVVPMFWNAFGYGFLQWLPMVVVVYAVGLTIEVCFAQWRGHEVAEGFFVTGFLIPMIMPPDVPLWILAVATAFSVVFAKEVFGGTGYNFLNPAVVARVFVFFAYPSVISGDKVWIAHPGMSDAVSGATPLAMESVAQIPSNWELFVGAIPGCIGETCKIAILIGALLLVFTQVADWRIMLSVLVGGAGMAAIFHAVGMTDVPVLTQLLMGGFLFGAVFMATDPVTAAHTRAGKYVYGLLVGIIAIMVRVLNKGYVEGMMLAILLMNVMAPLIDYCVIRIHIRKRKQRIARSRV